MRLSELFIATVAASAIEKRLLACAADIAPSTLSGWLSGDYTPRAGDRRVIVIGHLVSLSPDQCFSAAERGEVRS